MSQRELAEAVSSSHSYLGRIERGERQPSVHFLEEIAQRLDIPLPKFVEPYIESDPGPFRLYTFAQCLAFGNYIPKAREVLARADREAEKQPRKDNLYEANHWECLGAIHSQDGKLEKGLQSYQQALKIRQPMPSKSYELARAHFRVGTIALRLDRERLAEEHLSRAFWGIQWIDPEKSSVAKDRVTTTHHKVVHNYGLLLLRQRKPYIAWSMYRHAQFIWEKFGIGDDLNPWLLSDRAVSAIGARKFEEAERLLRNLLSRHDVSAGLRVGAHNNLGVLFRVKGKWEEAKRHQLAAWKLHEKDGGGSPQAICNELARCGLEGDGLEESRKWLARAQEATGDDLALKAETLLLLARCARKGNEPEKAVKYLDEVESLELEELPHSYLSKMERISIAVAERELGEINVLLKGLRRDLSHLII